MLVGSLIALIGEIVTATLPSSKYLPVVGIFKSIGINMLLITVVIYATEMAHPSFRGPTVGLINGFYLVGQLPGTFIPYATSTISDDRSWRVPTDIGFTFRILVLVGCILLPESPRWLIANNRQEEAHSILVRFN